MWSASAVAGNIRAFGYFRQYLPQSVAHDTRSVPGPPGQRAHHTSGTAPRPTRGHTVLFEFIQNAGIAALLLGLMLLFVMLVLGMIIVIRARKEDLPEVVYGLAEWFRRSRK